MSRSAVERLQAELGRRSELLEDELESLLADLVELFADPHAGSEREAKLLEIAELVSKLQACGDLSGRVATRFPSADAPEPARYARRKYGEPMPGDPREVVPWVVFESAVDDLRSRDPVGADALASMSLEVGQVYGPLPSSAGGTWYPHGFAAARAASDEAAKKSREILAQALERGQSTPRAVKRLARESGWTRSYSETVARTNFATATSAGRFREARRVEDQTGLRVGFEFQTAGDSDVRATHRPMDGLVARRDDPIWDRLSPPLAFNCRCVAIPVFGDRVPSDWVTAPAGARAEPGFGSRPGLTAYGR